MQIRIRATSLSYVDTDTLNLFVKQIPEGTQRVYFLKVFQVNGLVSQ